MNQRRKDAKLEMGKSAGFRPPDTEFCDTFNLAMEATGMSLNDLVIEAIRKGLTPAVSEILEQQRKAAATFLASRPTAPKGKKERQ